MRIVITAVAIAVLLAGGGLLGTRLAQGRAASPRRAAHVAARASGTPSPTPSPSATPTPAPPPTFMNDVPYTPQAPYGVWDAAHQHYCTAADTVMVEQYYQGDRRTTIPPAEADQKMTSIISWDRQTFPGVLALPLADVAQAGATAYGLHPVIEPLTLDGLQRQVASGRPVLVSVMTHGAPGGQAIAPYFGPENVHHTILIVGYDAPHGIVYANDPGYMGGRQHAYDWASLQVAIQAEASIYEPGVEMLYFTQ